MKYYILSQQLSPKGESGESAGSKYDLSSACEKCGTRAKLIGDLYTKGLKNLKHDYFYTLDHDDLMSEKLYAALEGVIKPAEVSKVVDLKGNPLPFYHLNPKLSFPKALPQSQGLKIENQCPVCKQNGYFSDAIIGDLEKEIPTYIVPLKLHYDPINETFLRQSNIFHTWEHLGLSNLKAEGNKVVRYARPMLIVSESAKEVFDSFKIKKLLFCEIIMHQHQIDLQ